ncbi:MAG TPA: tRNA pseudouridine(55) synthase TruB [Pirellulales bacterium]|nr:tRNA pseudouridine(55) synthase TruB [Pirellulales bacterium]
MAPPVAALPATSRRTTLNPDMVFSGSISAPHSGIVNIDKPAGKTSREVVDVVKRLVRPARTGHAGTLDPLATGVLVVCVGAATRLIEYVQRAPKRYRATFLLGRASPTEDIEGEVTILPDPPRPERAEIVAAAARLTGAIMQRPPAFSALRVGGRRSYDLARAGRAVELAPRPITIHAIEVLEYEYPQLVLDIRCGSGTYIRSLGRDLAESLGTAAVMAGLARTEIGPFHQNEAWRCEALVSADCHAWLRPMRDAVRNLPAVTLTAEQIDMIGHGRFLDLADVSDARGSELAALDAHGELVAILRERAPGQYGPRLNLLPRA